MSDMKISMQPLKASSIESRCRCGICGARPNVSAKSNSDSGFITVTAHCCGKAETRTIGKSDLFYTQVFFKEAGVGNDFSDEE